MPYSVLYDLLRLLIEIVIVRGHGDGLKPPLLGITDGDTGLLSAFEQVFPESLRQRCAVHVARNLVAKVSRPDQEAVKKDY